MSSPDGDHRQYERYDWRIPCVFQIAGTRYQGFVSNVSARGFFIQSSSRFDSDSEVQVTIEEEGGPPIVITGRVARRRNAHRSIASVDKSGLGIQIDSAPEAYYQLVLALEEKK